MLTLLLFACASDYSVHELCVEHEEGFDIEAVSVLQDAAGYPGSRDAVTLRLDPGPEVEAWRVARVEVLAMVPAWAFDDYDGGDVLQIDVFDGSDPRDDAHYSVRQPIEPDELDWEPVELPPDAHWAGLRGELVQRQAWMSFDLSGEIPEEGLQSETTTIGVTWGDRGLPTIGYSNFNLDCGANWTDYGDGRWEANGADGDQMECSWPMLRVELETRSYADSCTGASAAVE
jgi:hypothetical protein